MPILGGLLVTLFSGLVDFFVRFFSRGVALRLAFAALIVAAFGTLYAALAVSVAGLVYAMPAGLVAAFQFALPGNISACVSVALAADAAVAGFRLYVVGLRV